MKRQIEIDGKIREIEFPDDATDQEIDEIVNSEIGNEPVVAPGPGKRQGYFERVGQEVESAWKDAGREAVETTQRRSSDFRAIDQGGAGGPIGRGSARIAGGALSAYQHVGQGLDALARTAFSPITAAFTGPKDPNVNPRPLPVPTGAPGYAQQPTSGTMEGYQVPKPVADYAQHLGQQIQSMSPEEKATNKASLAILGSVPLGKAASGAVKGGKNVLNEPLRWSKTYKGPFPKPDASPVLNEIRSMIDPQLGAVPTSDGGLKRLKDMTIEDVRALIDEVMKSPKVQQQIDPQAIPAIREDAFNALKEEMVQLRRDIKELPLTKRELNEAKKGKLNAPLQSEGVPISVPEVKGPGAAGWGRMVNERLLKGLSDKQAEGTPDFDRLVDMARQYKLDRSMDNPLVVAGEESLGKAFKNFDSKIKDLADAKELLLQQSRAQIDISDLKKEWIDSVRKVARAEIGSKQVKDELDNTVTRRALINPAGGHKIDPDSDEAILEITNALLDAPDVLTAKHADDLKRFIQHRRYSSVGMIPDVADRLSGDFANRLNKKLQADLGDRYKVINQNLRDYIGLEEILARSLGKPVDVEKGIHRNVASVMKNAGTGITRTDLQALFRKVKELSAGAYDPYQASAYAEAAMKVVGDDPIFTLAELPDVAKIKSAMPTSWFDATVKGLSVAPKTIGKVASGGKDDADFLVEYWRKAQGRKGPDHPGLGDLGNSLPPTQPYNPDSPFGKLIESPQMSKEMIEALARMGRTRLTEAKNTPKLVPPGELDPSDPFLKLELATKNNSPEAFALANARANQAAGLTERHFNPPDFDKAMDEADQAAYSNVMLRAQGAGKDIAGETAQALRNDIFPNIRGEIKAGKLSVQDKRRLTAIAESSNFMYDNDPAEWRAIYGERGYPERNDLTADDLIQWMNEKTTSGGNLKGPSLGGLQGKGGPGIVPFADAGRMPMGGTLARTGLGAAAGAGIGATQGETPEERFQNAMQLGIGGGLAAFGAPGLAKMAKSGFKEGPASVNAGLYAGKSAKGFEAAEGKFSSLTDREPRFEIDDSKAKVTKWGETNDLGIDKGDRWMDLLRGKPVSIEDLLNHEELYKQYPELKNNTIVKMVKGGDANASIRYKDGLNIIELNEKMLFKDNPDEAIKKTLLHEIQHAIQKKEGFASGGSPAKYAQEKDEAMARINFLNNELSRISKQMDDKNISPKTKAALREEYDAAMEEKFRIWDIANMDDHPMESYWKTAGEVEARDVSARSNMPSTERSKTQPLSSQKIPLEDMIVKKEGNGTARAMKGKK